MFTNVAAGALVVLGILLAVLGVFAAGNLVVILVGLGSIAVGGLLGLLDRRRPA